MKLRQQLSRRSLIFLQFLIASLIFSVIIFVLVQPIKFALSFFAASLAGVIYLVIFKYDSKRFKLNFSAAKHLEIMFIVCTGIILILNLIPFKEPILQFLLSLPVVLFLPGITVLKLCRIDSKINSKTGTLVLSFVLSIGLSSGLFLFSLGLNQSGVRPIFLSSMYVVISLIPILVRTIFKRHIPDRSVSNARERNYNLVLVIALIWISCFFVYSISILYPQMADMPGYDIVRHYSAAKALTFENPLYSSVYPWFHFTLADIIEISHTPQWLFQWGIAYLSLLLLFAFYGMASAYLKDIDRRAPILSTIFFFVFSGIGWIYLLRKLIEIPDVVNHFDVLSLSSTATYWDIGLGQSPWLWLWFRPLTVGAILIFAMLYLMRREGISRSRFIFLGSLIMLILCQVHLSEVLLFVIFAFVLALLFPSMKVRIEDTAIASILGVGSALLILNIGYLRIFGSGFFVSADQYSSNQFMIIACFISGLTFLLARFRKRPSLPKRIGKTKITLIASVFFFIFFVFIVHWYITATDFRIAEIFAVPSQFYPVLLGIIGAFAIPSTVIVVRKHRRHPVFIFVVFFVLMIIFGRVLTVFNANFISNDQYSERRIIPYVFVACSILSPILVIAVLESLNKWVSNSKKLKYIQSLILFGSISVFIIVGIFSTFLTIEYQLFNISKIGLTDRETRIQNLFVGLDPHSTFLSLTNRSKDIAEFANFGYIVGFFKFQIWPSKSPELPLHILSALNSSSVVYLSPSDNRQIVVNNYDQGYVSSHLLKAMSSVQGKSTNETLTVIPKLAPPAPKSKTILVLPNEFSKSTYYSYDTMSLAGYNYTTALLSDLNSFNNASTIVAPTEDTALKVMDYDRKYNLKFNKLIILNLDGYGSISKNLTILEGHSISDLEGNASLNWIPMGLGSGSIGIPKLVGDLKLPKSGNLVTFNVGSGNYSLWQLSRTLEKPLDLSKFNFVNFDWYGRDSGKWYVVQFTSNLNEFYWYRFQDNWHGWREVVLPLAVPDGRYENLGVVFEKQTTGNPIWTHVIRIDVRTEALNINQKGTFYFDEFSFGRTLNSSVIEDIKNNRNLILPNALKLLPVVASQGNGTISKFSGTNMPFIIHRALDDYDLYYINILPVIEKIDSGDSAAARYYPLLGKVTASLNNNIGFYNFNGQSKTSISKLVSGGVGSFRDAKVFGNISIESPSSIIKLDSEKINVRLAGKNLTLSNVIEIVPINTKKVVIKENELGFVKGGFGFYTNITLKSPTINFIGDPSSVLVTFSNKTNITLKAEKIILYLPQSDIWSRLPSISLAGKILLDQFYAYGDLSNKLKVLGSNLEINGKVHFDAEYSDNFIVTRNFVPEGKISGIPQKYPFDELKNLSNIFQYNNIRHILAIFLIFVAIDVFILRGTKSRIVPKGS